MGGWLRAVITVACAAGCGRIAFDPLDDSGSALPDGPCTEWQAFEPPVHVPPPVTTTQAGEWHPWISASGLALYYYEIYTGSNDIVVATRQSVDEPFGAFAPITEINSPERDAFPTVSGDELTIIFDSMRPNLVAADLWMATRVSLTAAFDPPTAMTALNTAATEQSAALSPDGLELFFMRDTGVTAIYVSTRADTTQPFTTVASIDEVLPPAGYRNHKVTISADDKELYLSSNRPGGIGSYDVWVSRRDGRGMPFGSPVLVPELSSPGDDGIDSLSADGRTAYMFYNANLGANADISTATRSCR